jgi:hypothetical protein
MLSLHRCVSLPAVALLLAELAQLDEDVVHVLQGDLSVEEDLEPLDDDFFDLAGGTGRYRWVAYSRPSIHAFREGAHGFAWSHFFMAVMMGKCLLLTANLVCVCMCVYVCVCVCVCVVLT